MLKKIKIILSTILLIMPYTFNKITAMKIKQPSEIKTYNGNSIAHITTQTTN